MTEVVLDANALIMPFDSSINLDDELERVIGNPKIYVPSSVIDELNALERKDALKLAERYKTIDVEESKDTGVLEAAEKLDAVIVTNDRGLLERARKKGLAVAFLRGISHLELIGEIF
ncbi:MAG: twitching motility protein PilT [Thermoplasmata archaeon]